MKNTIINALLVCIIVLLLLVLWRDRKSSVPQWVKEDTNQVVLRITNATDRTITVTFPSAIEATSKTWFTQSWTIPLTNHDAQLPAVSLSLVDPTTGQLVTVANITKVEIDPDDPRIVLYHYGRTNVYRLDLRVPAWEVNR